MEYQFQEIEKKWRQYWENNQTFAAHNTSDKPKYYVLDMFPYPSGAGLHVGHPLGYIASDILARYKKHKGFNVLHPMGFDAFGLPAEQYAISTGKHPAETTATNIERYIAQLKNIGFAYDWNRMVNTSNASYYRWTQWIFIQLFESYYDTKLQKAQPVTSLVSYFETYGSEGTTAFGEPHDSFTAQEWKAKTAAEQAEVLMQYRLAYQSYAYVNWCEGLGTVLANDEVKDGVSERGGFPVERKRMRQWFLRITAYAERLLNDLEALDWSDSMKEMQRNWIGKSEGARVHFALQNPVDEHTHITVFTTRPDTIFGVSFLVLAPEHPLVSHLTTAAQKAEVDAYVQATKNRSERERMADVNRVTGAFTGAYVKHPFTGTEVPVWIGDYVLAGYGTGAVMAVPGHDGRDFKFAKHFSLPIPRVIAGPDEATGELTEAYEAKDGTVINSDFLNGLPVKKAISACIEALTQHGTGQREINYRLRDANFSRQRYWGEPYPIVYKNGVAQAVDSSQLPVELPVMDDFKPTGRPESPLVKAIDWVNIDTETQRETDTMPGFAGSSWYFLRYMDPQNSATFAAPDALKYWQDVDVYIGGTEHAVGHLLYARFWHKFLFDNGYLPVNEPFKKLVNQGMIQGRSNFAYRVVRQNQQTADEVYVSKSVADQIEQAGAAGICIEGLNKLMSWPSETRIVKTQKIHVDVNCVHNDVLDIDRLKANYPHFANAQFYSDTDDFTCGSEVEKMSKSKLNVINPDDIVLQYGADTLRMYEMFLGPIEQSKPWNTNGIEGVHKFLRKLWRQCIDKDGQSALTTEEPTQKELKILHKTIRKITDDIEQLSLNTCISAFMICLNELTDAQCTKRAIYEPLLVLLSPFAPHICEEIWNRMGHSESIANAAFPVFNADFLVEDSFEYPVSFNGKVRFKLAFSAQTDVKSIEAAVLEDAQTMRWLEGKTPKKIIVVSNRIINIVL